MPAAFAACAKNVSIICILAENAYADAVKESFGRDPDTKEIIYPEAQCKEVLKIKTKTQKKKIQTKTQKIQRMKRRKQMNKSMQ